MGLALLCSLTLFLLVSVWFSHSFQIVSSIVMLFEDSAVLDEFLRQPELQEFRQVDASGILLDKTKRPNLILIMSESWEPLHHCLHVFPSLWTSFALFTVYER